MSTPMIQNILIGNFQTSWSSCNSITAENKQQNEKEEGGIFFSNVNF